MKIAVLASLLLGAFCGCSAPLRDAKMLVRTTPANAPQMLGTYDFDLLEVVTAKACVEPNDRTIYRTVILGVDTKTDDGTHMARAEGAAIFEAIGKVQGADALLVTRIRTEAETPDFLGQNGRACSTVWGRGVRLKKGPLLTPSSAGVGTGDDGGAP